MRQDIKKSLIFGITHKDLQQLALESIGRRLNGNEKDDLAQVILYHFKDWDNWIKEIIASEFLE